MRSIAFMHPVGSPGELWVGLLRGTVRTSAIVRPVRGRITSRRCTSYEGHPSQPIGAIDMTQARTPTPHRREGAVPSSLLDLRPGPGVRRPVAPAADAVARGLAAAQVYAFASVDYPGAAISQVYDSDGTTTVGAFDFDPGGTAQTTAFTFSGGAYQILAVPSSTASIATGINATGLLIGAYADLVGDIHGFASNGGSFSDVDFPGSTRTLAIGVNDVGQIVGSFTDGASVNHGFVMNGSGAFSAIDFPGATSTEAAGINTAGDIVGVWSDSTGSHSFVLHAGLFSPIAFPLATTTTAFGINDAGEIAGSYTDAAGNQHGFVLADGAFSSVDVAGAAGSQLTRIKNDGLVTGIYTDAVTGVHGLVGR
jgi:hypothetical protein